MAASCVSRPEGSRWAGDYRETAVFGDSDDEALGGMRLGGIAVTESIVYVLETERVALWLLRPDLSVIRRIVVSGNQEAGLSFSQSRFMHVGDTLYYSSDGYDILPAIQREGGVKGPLQREVVDGRSPWRVRMRVDGRDHLLLQLGLVPVTGRWGVGPAHALPLWDTNGACVVASDGAEPLLVYATVGGRQDTLRVPVPDHVERMSDYADQLGGLLPPEAIRQEPASPKRIRDLVIDPDGWVWLWTVRRRGSTPGEVQVLRVPLGGGQAVLDTVPAFPRAFGPPGVFYAETRGPDDELLLARYDLGR